MERVRRVVTGVEEGGGSVFVRDDNVEPVRPPILGGNTLHILYGDDAPVVAPTSGEVRDDLTWLPNPGGYRFLMFTYPPASRRVFPGGLEASIAETDRTLPGLTDIVSGANGMHTTPTVDLEYVVAGELILTLDSGQQKTLRAGDVLIQCGASHAWSNDGDTEATMLLVFVGAGQ
jgi:hypothetical protein